jgi:1,4-alpha-glucan branching enzyme
MLYSFSENFVLPFSHDEVVHGKRSLLDKMPGDAWQKFASLRVLYTFLFTYPGKKLLFMGCEFAQGREWNYSDSLDWYLLTLEPHQGIQRLISDLNQVYKDLPSLHSIDFSPDGFEWIDCHDNSQSVLSFMRKDMYGHIAIIILNFTPVLRENYRIGVPIAGFYKEFINSDAACYWGSNQGNNGGVYTEAMQWMGHAHSLNLTLPPLAGLILTTNYNTDQIQLDA